MKNRDHHGMDKLSCVAASFFVFDRAKDAIEPDVMFLASGMDKGGGSILDSESNLIA